MSMMFVIIGMLMARIITFPASKILSARLPQPVSTQMLDANSVKYPMPIIFKTMLNKFAESPVFSTTMLNTLKIWATYSTSINTIIIPPAIAITEAMSGLTCLTIKHVMQVTSPNPKIFTSSKYAP